MGWVEEGRALGLFGILGRGVLAEFRIDLGIEKRKSYTEECPVLEEIVLYGGLMGETGFRFGVIQSERQDF